MSESKTEYFIRPGSMSWDLVKRYQRKEGKEKGQMATVFIGYFKSREQAAKQLLDLLAREGLSGRELCASEMGYINQTIDAALNDVMAAISKDQI